MATISIDYDSSQGDVELILEDREDPRLHQAEDEASTSCEQTKVALYNVVVKVKEIHLRVSSLRLASSSEYFRAMLEGSRFPEGQALKDNGFVRIRLSDPEDKPEAIMIIIGVLYEKDVQLPTKIDFQTLQKVAVLVDKYQWHIPITPHMISWFDGLKDSPEFPIAFDEDLLTWLWIAWLFGMKDQFKSVSRFVQQQACKSIDPMEEGIRVPKRVVEAINKQRGAAFQKIEETISSMREVLLRKYPDEDTPQYTLLRAMALGFLSLCSQNLQLGEFRTPDHAGCSVRWLERSINSLETMKGFTVCPSNNHGGRWIREGGPWDVEKILQDAMTDLKIEEWGLDYDDFKPTIKRP
ncbi:hypothetical protein NA56DRAFT_643173 [Hyaloscypha hepaticicola]|uniref:BTB domain-containing protein n=1 Tax=Hyaloscypha hepaticicola TaxID=2082293 RepID=A0A2J6QEF6_9HELO|nr:hypothetical protein NA56DRAFT_643173 [Hyaloscypha hepaticicola]